jgi:hypothetical protein
MCRARDDASGLGGSARIAAQLIVAKRDHAMTEIYCELTHRAAAVPAAPAEQQRAALAYHLEHIRRRIGEVLGDGIDIGVARPSPPLSIPISIRVELFFKESSLRNDLSRLIEAEAEAAGLAVYVDLNTKVLQKRLDVVAFEADPRAAIAAVREALPRVPVSFEAAGNDRLGMKRYAVIAHNIGRIADFDDRETMDEVDGVLAQRLPAMGGYRRCGKS